MKLSVTKINGAKAKDKPYKLFDGAGLFILVHPNGSKYWRFKYRYGGKEKLLSLGLYPDFSLREAREMRDDLRKKVVRGIDPAAERKASRTTQAGADSFEAVAREWFEKNESTWAESYSSKVKLRLEKYVFPWLGKRSIAEIEAPEILDVLRKLEKRDVVETAHRVKQICSRVFRYAIATGRARRDPAADLTGALPPRSSNKHFAAITDPRRVGALMRAIEAYDGGIVTQCALRLAPLVFVRPGELRMAEWVEIDLDAAEWRIPAQKMKMKQAHIVPLSRQAIEIFQEIGPVTGNGRYVFPGARSRSRPMSENAITASLRRMGYTGEEMTGHGFRSMASTLLNEQGWNRDAIERQLAHAERSGVRAAYNHAEYLPERRRMMQAWADYLDKLKTQNNGSGALPTAQLGMDENPSD